MAKKVKFPLDMGNEVYVRTLEELKENYDTEKVTEYFLDGRLITWLNDRYYDEEAEQVQELIDRDDKDDLAAKLGKIFGIEIESEVDIEALEIRREKLEKLRRITSDDNILNNADFVAFSQEELGDLLDEGAEVIYLCGEKFRIPLSVENVKYIGVNNPTVTISGKGEIDLEKSGIVFENCEFSDDTKARFSNSDNSSRTAPKPANSNINFFGKEYTDNDQEEDDEDFTNDEDFEFDVEKGYVTLVSYDGSDRIVRVPDIVNEIADSAFEDCSAEIIELPDDIETIGDSAFCDCKNLKSVTLPCGLESLGDFAFSGCEKLTEIVIPDDVEVIGEETFADCKSLTSVKLPDNLETIEASAFSGCERLSEIEIPDSVTEIKEYAFSGCTNLKKVYLPDDIEMLGENEEDSEVFDGCKNVSVEYDGDTYRYGRLKSLYIKINCK